jgi:dipeptidyl aminopeptidase/acylaminoacyl peptidase
MLTAEPPPSGPPIPRRVLFSDPDRVNPVLSPEGTLLVYAAPYEGALNVWVQVLDGLDADGPARPVTATRHGIAEFVVCTERRLVYTEDTGDGEAWRLYVLDLETGASRLVIPGGDGEVHILSYNPSCSPDQLLLTLRRDDRSPHDVWELDLDTGEMTEVAPNPGHDDGPLFDTWLVDPTLHVLGGVSCAPDGGAVIHRRTGPDGHGPYQPLIHIPGEDLDPSAAIQLTWDDALFTITSLGAQTLRLVRIDTVTGDLTVISGDSDADVVDVWWDPASLRPVVAAYGPGQPELRVMDPTWAADVEALKEHTDAAADLRLVSADSLGALLLIEATAPDAPARYYLYSAKAGQGRYLFCDREALAGYRLAPTTLVNIPTGDGWELRCHLTRPLDAPDGPLPAVLQIHNGHQTRGDWRYHPETQWLASLGYAVITAHTAPQPLGHDAFDAVADLAHGLVAHLAADAVVDPDRIGLYGASDDGYAALCGAASGPVFRCAVSACGPDDLTAMLTTRPGAHQIDADWARRTAQLTYADRNAPMLIAEGISLPHANSQLDALAADLTRDEIPHRLIDFGGEGRGMVLRHTRETFFTAVEAVFAAYLGGTCEPTATTACPARPLQE